MSEMENYYETLDQKPKGNMLLGMLGALLGALGGGLLFALLFLLGMIHSAVGLATGALASFLYTKFGGKSGVLHVISVLLAIVIGISVGVAGGYTLIMLKEYASLDDPQVSAVQAVRMMWEKYVLYDQTTMLGMEYDRELATIPETQRLFVMSKDEFVARYYDASLDREREEIRDEIRQNWLMGMFYGLLGGVGVLISLGGQKNKAKRAESV